MSDLKEATIAELVIARIATSLIRIQQIYKELTRVDRRDHLDPLSLPDQCAVTVWPSLETYDTNTNDRRLKAITNSGATRSFNFTTTPEDLITQIQETAPNGTAWAPKTWN
jgi:hypothetical protein